MRNTVQQKSQENEDSKERKERTKNAQLRAVELNQELKNSKLSSARDVVFGSKAASDKSSNQISDIKLPSLCQTLAPMDAPNVEDAMEQARVKLEYQFLREMTKLKGFATEKGRGPNGLELKSTEEVVDNALASGDLTAADAKLIRGFLSSKQGQIQSASAKFSKFILEQSNRLSKSNRLDIVDMLNQAHRFGVLDNNEVLLLQESFATSNSKLNQALRKVASQEAGQNLVGFGVDRAVERGLITEEQAKAISTHLNEPEVAQELREVSELLKKQR